MDISRHRYFMMQVLLALFRDKELSVHLAFKGGTSLLLFHQLPRFSTDLDISMLRERQLHQLIEEHATVELFSRKGDIVSLSL